MTTRLFTVVSKMQSKLSELANKKGETNHRYTLPDELKNKPKRSYRFESYLYQKIKAGEFSSYVLIPKTKNKRQRELSETVCGIAHKRINGKLVGDSYINDVTQFISDNMRYMTPEFLDCVEELAMASGLFVLAYNIREKNYELVFRLAKTGKLFLFNKPSTALRNVYRLFWCNLIYGYDDAIKGLLTYKYVRRNTIIAQHIRGLCGIFGILPKEQFPKIPKHIPKTWIFPIM